MTNTITFPNDSISYTVPSWLQLNQLSFKLTQQIIADDYQADRVVTLAKGGWPMSKTILDFLSIDKVASIGVKFYCDVNQRCSQPQIYQHLPVTVEGERVILYDDVADTGESLQFITNYLQQRGVADIKTATLYYKPHSKIKPDFYAAETDAWIIFPHDVVEIINSLVPKWRQQQVIDRLKKFNFQPEWIEFYLPKVK